MLSTLRKYLSPSMKEYIKKNSSGSVTSSARKTHSLTFSALKNTSATQTERGPGKIFSVHLSSSAFSFHFVDSILFSFHLRWKEGVLLRSKNLGHIYWSDGGYRTSLKASSQHSVLSTCRQDVARLPEFGWKSWTCYKLAKQLCFGGKVSF